MCLIFRTGWDLGNLGPSILYTGKLRAREATNVSTGAKLGEKVGGGGTSKKCVYRFNAGVNPVCALPWLPRGALVARGGKHFT